MPRKYSDEALKVLVPTCTSITQVATLLGVCLKSSSSITGVSRRIKSLKLDMTHFIGNRWAAGKQFSHRKQPLEFYLRRGIVVSSSLLKRRLIKKWCRSYGIAKPPRGYWTKNPYLEDKCSS